MVLFIYSIIAKWYVMVAVISITVVFWVFKGLEEAKIFDEVGTIFAKVAEDSHKIAKYCTPKIRDLSAVWKCIDEIDNKQLDEKDREKTKQLTKDIVGPSGHADSLDVETVVNPYSQLINK